MSDLVGIGGQLEQILNDYAKKVDKDCNEVMEEVSKQTVETLRATSPVRQGKGGGKYAKSWAVTKQKGTYIVHNKKYYRLTHLLNNGHVIENQYGTYGRYEGDNHIGKAEAQAQEKVIARLKQKL